jgi:hypothetical protein
LPGIVVISRNSFKIYSLSQPVYEERKKKHIEAMKIFGKKDIDIPTRLNLSGCAAGV